MKSKLKKLSAVLAASAVIASLFVMRASAKEIKVLYNGEELSFDVSPTVINDRVMVPVRAVFEAFGAKVKWDGSTKTVTAKKKSNTVEMTIDSAEMKKNDETVTFDVSPVIENGRTLVPLRAVGELLELDVSWDENTKTVDINKKSDDEDESWKKNTGTVDLSAFTVSGAGNSAESGVITITEAGDYAVTGKCDDGQIVIDSKGKVKLRLSGMSLTNTKGAAIYVKDADKLYITLTEDTENYLSDGETYENDKEKGCITSKDSVEIKGKGSLTVNASYNHGIQVSDSLEIENGKISITAKNDAIHVNDTCEISGGTLDLTVYGDGIQSEEILDITGGTINITTKGDVPEATNEKHFGGMRTNAEAEEETEEDESVSSKGIKADWLMEISGGTINITSTDHAVHCASDIIINGGDITVNSGNKGISAHGDLTINGGNFNMPKVSEGIESKQIMTINDGTFYIIASDDGLNAGGGDGFGGFGGGAPFGRNGENAQDGENGQMPEGESMQRGMRGRGGRGARMSENGNMPEMGGMPDFENGQQPGMPPQMGENGNMPEMGGMPDFGGGMPRGDGNMPDFGGEMPRGDGEMPDFGGGMPPMDFGALENGDGATGEDRMGNFRMAFVQLTDEISTEHHIQINGGSFYICAVNDGIDANGSLTITGGNIVVEGRSVAAGGELGLDADGKITISGGDVLAAGSTVKESGAEQNTALINLSSPANIGSRFEIKDDEENTIAGIESVKKEFSQILYSSDKLKDGKTYSVYVDGEKVDTFTVEAKLTNVGTAQSGGFGGGMRMRSQQTQ